MKTVAFVPIKLNNERLPNKNILPLGGKPLCQHMLESLLKVDGIDEVYVFCSDKAIAKYLPSGITFLQRDKDLDANDVKHYQIVNRFVSEVYADIYVNAHVTTPFIKKGSIELGLSKVISGEHDSAHVVEEVKQFCWHEGKPFNFTRNELPRTQDLEPLYMDGAVFIYRREVYTKHQSRYGNNPFFVVVDRLEAIDIDYPDDYELAKAVCHMLNGEKQE